MPSPFPGMDPYVEQDDIFHDFHERFCPACAEALTALVRPKYFVKIDQHVFIHELPAEPKQLVGRGDVMLLPRRPTETSDSAAGVLQAPAYGRIPLTVDIEKQSFLEIGAILGWCLMAGWKGAVEGIVFGFFGGLGGIIGGVAAGCPWEWE